MRAGFTLTEVMVAIVLLVIFSVAAITGIMMSSRMTRLNSNAIAAKNIAQGFFERMAIDEFANVGPDAYPDIDYDDPNPVWLDQPMGITCRVEFRFSGFGRLTNSSSNNLTIANNQWVPGEWAGDTIFLISGKGAGQFARISSNTPNTLHLESSLAISPDSTTRYMINNGKTVTITTTWEYMGREYTQSISSLVTNYRGSGNMGF